VTVGNVGDVGDVDDDAAKNRLQELLAELERTLGELESSDEPSDAVDRLAAMADLAREVQAEVDRLRREGDAADASD
jgi:polyhydroxyalkanoate synthesis regulator phasin